MKKKGLRKIVTLKGIARISCLLLVMLSIACSASDSEIVIADPTDTESEEETTPETESETEPETEPETEQETETEPETAPETEPEPETDLDANQPPSVNFDLSRWYLTLPVDTDDDGKADTVKEDALNAAYEDEDFFYTGANGGMVLISPIEGAKTSLDTGYTRTELREMLRAGNTDIETQGVNANNWVFGSAPQDDIDNAYGYDGELKATLAVNYVTTTGDSDQVGRVIVGQIHANNDEPLRLYYRKLPNNELGSIYFAHEKNGDGEDYYDIIGSRSSYASNPEDGVALDEKFSYSVQVVGNDMWVTIYREGKPDVQEYVDMSDSGYDEGGQYMYFKAGVYNQNDSGDGDDYVKATFYSLSSSHTN